MPLVHALLPVVASLVALASCGATRSTYVPPSRGADLQAIAPQSAGRADIEEILSRKPTGEWPAVIAAVRVQSHFENGASRSETRIVPAQVVSGVREIETDEQLARLGALPNVRGVALASPLLFAGAIDDDLDLRAGAAAMHADLLLVYTLNTTIRQEDDSPILRIFTPGIAPTVQESVTATAQSILLDVRTGAFLGAAEATERGERRLSSALHDDSGERRYLELEREAFQKLVGAFESTWPAVVERFAPQAASAP